MKGDGVLHLIKMRAEHLMKQTILLALLLLIIGAFPLAAQDAPTDVETLANWVPADSVGFIALRADDNMLPSLAFSLNVAGILQPTRVAPPQSLSPEYFFPLADFDIENARYAQLIAPWLGDEVVLVYRDLTPAFTAERGNVLMLAEAQDAFAAAQVLSAVIQGQQLAFEEVYRDVTLYVGDRTTLAIASNVVMIGSREMIRAALDSNADDASSMADSDVYQAVRNAAPTDAAAFAYFHEAAAVSAFSVLLSGSDIGAPILATLGDALEIAGGRDTLEAALLRGAVDGVGISLFPDTLLQQSYRAVATVHTSLRTPTDSADVAENVLQMIPRNAMVVQSGPDAREAAYGLALALPLTNFANDALFAFPLPGASPALRAIMREPTSQDVRAAFETLEATLESASDLSLREDVLDVFEGSYSVALLPRPNSALPVFNTPYDMLLVAQTRDGAAAADGVTQLIQTFLNAEAFEEETIDDYPFTSLLVPFTTEPVLRIGHIDERLLVGTGAAVEQAIAAFNGDNRLIEEERWQALVGESAPHLYVDINAFYSTFIPELPAELRRPFRQLGVRSQYVGDGVYEMDMLINLGG
jgi:Protein of unknown function (DUF3352)